METARHLRPWIIFLIAECLVLFVLCLQLHHRPDGHLHAYVLNVGQGDSILLVSPSGKQILVDGGPDLSTLPELGRLMPNTDRTIELLVMTHPDADHFTSFPEILRRYDVQNVLLTGIQKDGARYQEFLSLLEREGSNILHPDPGEDIDIGDGLVLDILWPNPGLAGTKPSDSNDTGIAMRAMANGKSILLSADIEKPVETAILASGEELKADVLKVAHHGSRTSSSTGFLLAVDPEQAIVSVANPSPYGHPHPDVVERYRFFGIPLHSTAKEGTIEVSF